jgi:hypothetical protein
MLKNVETERMTWVGGRAVVTDEREDHHHVGVRHVNRLLRDEHLPRDRGMGLPGTRVGVSTGREEAPTEGSLEGNLPLQGRQLRYLCAALAGCLALMVVVGMVLLFVAGMTALLHESRVSPGAAEW